MKRRSFVKKISAGGSGLLAGLGMTGINLNNPNPYSPSEKDEHNYSRQYPVNLPATCNLKQYKGKPTIFVNGKPYFPLAYLSHFPEPFRYKNMHELGTRFFGSYISLGDRFMGFYKNQRVRLRKYNIWIAPGKIDFDIFDDTINEILDIAPDAYLIPRISCNSPSWWDSYHPAETCRTYEKGLPQCQSFSSIIWREDTAEVLREIVRHVYQSEYAERFIGMHICVGETNESVHLGWLGSTDYSLIAQKKFKEWLLHRYNNDHELIRELFGKPIDQIEIPLPEEREKTEFGDFFDPVKSRLNIDYRFFRCNEIVESFDFLCKAVKEESKGNLLTGTFYGHTFAQWLDHMAFSKALKSPYIDFYTSTTWGTEVDSIKKANKLFYNEGDEKTCIGKWISEMRPEIDPYHEYDLPVWKRQGTMEQTLEHLKSEFAHALCSGSAIYWYDLWGGWYDHERILNLFGEIQKVADESIHLEGDSIAEVCVIVDERSFLYISRLRRQWVNDIPWINGQKAQIEKFGAPYDIFLAEDLDDLDVSKYKMIIFFNTFLLNDEERKMICRKCMSDGRILMWLYAPGLINGDHISIGNVSSLIDMEIEYKADRSGSDIDIELPDLNLTYTGSNVSPFFYVKSRADKVAGRTRDGYTVVAEKNNKDYTNIFITNPPIPWQVIQYYAKIAGVHIYSNDGDIVYGNQSYLYIRGSKPGERTIQVPDNYGLTELLNSDDEFKSDRNKKIEPDNKKIIINFPESGRVRFYKWVKK